MSKSPCVDDVASHSGISFEPHNHTLLFLGYKSAEGCISRGPYPYLGDWSQVKGQWERTLCDTIVGGRRRAEGRPIAGQL